MRTRVCGREDIALLAEHWPRARELFEELVVGEDPAHWLIDVNAEAAAAVLCAPPALDGGDGGGEALIDLVRASRGATPRVVEHIAALAADPGADPEPLIAVLEETPITPEVCDIAAALADRPAGAPRSRGWARPDPGRWCRFCGAAGAFWCGVLTGAVIMLCGVSTCRKVA